LGIPVRSQQEYTLARSRLNYWTSVLATCQAFILLGLDAWLSNDAVNNPYLTRWILNVTGLNPVLLIDSVIMGTAGFAVVSLIMVIKMPAFAVLSAAGDLNRRWVPTAPTPRTGASYSIPPPPVQYRPVSSTVRAGETELLHMGFYRDPALDVPEIQTKGPGEMVENIPPPRAQVPQEVKIPEPVLPKIPNGGPAEISAVLPQRGNIQAPKSVVLLLQARRHLVVEEPEPKKKK
jgi:hypothetical protein